MAPQSEDRTAFVTKVAKCPIDGMEGKEGRSLTVEYPPGVHEAPRPLTLSSTSPLATLP
jgi:hypothetical protein